MKQFFYLTAFCALALAACTGSFKKGDKGLEYKIIANGSGNKIGYGDYIQLHIKQVYGGTKDTVLSDSHEFMPRIQVFDSVNTPIEYFKILKEMRKGDSLIIRLRTDSVFKGGQQEMPPFMKKGKFLYTHVTLVNVFKTREAADSANNAERTAAKPRIFKKQLSEIEKEIAKSKTQLDIDNKIIADYLAKNNIKAQKTNWGTYISVVTEGTGSPIDGNSIVTVNYTGKTLDSGKVFDSNLDPAFKHVQPLEVTISEFRVVFGWIDALLKLKNGSKVVLYIPSSLGYGVQGNGGDIKPNANLIFEMEITDVTTEEAFAARQQKMQQELQDKMKEAEKLREDSVKMSGKK